MILCIVNNLEILGLVISGIAMIVSAIALIYTIKTFWLKKGCDVRCNLTTSSSFETEEVYVDEIELENLKDKTIAIYNIYLRFGANVYLDLLCHPTSMEASTQTVILNPYEVKVIKLPPQVIYVSDLQRVLGVEKYLNIKSKVVLSTNYGKIEVKNNVKRWEPLSDYWKNYSTQIIQPFRLFHGGDTYNDRCYGSRILYLVNVSLGDGTKLNCPIYKDVKVQFFSKLTFTDASLNSKEDLVKFLYEQRNSNNIEFKDIEVIDLKSEVEGIKSRYHSTIEMEPISKFRYYTIERIRTVFYKYRFKYGKSN